MKAGAELGEKNRSHQIRMTNRRVGEARRVCTTMA